MDKTRVHIRIAKPTEQKAIEAFFARYEYEEVLDLLRDYLNSSFSNDYRRPTFVIALEDDQIIGAAAFSEELFTIETWGISCVIVHPEKRRQGIGQMLVESCEEHIRRCAGKTVTAILNTFPDKTALYDRLGFQKAGQDHTGGWYMIKVLKANKS